MSQSTSNDAPPTLSVHELVALVSTLQTEVLGLKQLVLERETRAGSLEETIVNLTQENEILKRRLFGNKTERSKTSELQLTLGDLLEDEKQLQKQLDAAVAAAKKQDQDQGPAAEKANPKPKGRRDLSVSGLPKVLVQILDEELEKSGKRIGFDVSRELMFQRGGWRVLSNESPSTRSRVPTAKASSGFRLHRDCSVGACCTPPPLHTCLCRSSRSACLTIASSNTSAIKVSSSTAA